MLQRNLRAMIVGINHTTSMGQFCWLLVAWVSKCEDMLLLVCIVNLHCVIYKILSTYGYFLIYRCSLYQSGLQTCVVSPQSNK